MINTYYVILIVVHMLSLVFVDEVFASDGSLCRDMRHVFNARQLKQQPSRFMVDTVNREGNDFEYLNVDLDLDNRPDSLLQSCGSQGYGSCTLFASLSGGSSFEFTDSHFFVIRFRENYYALVGGGLPESRLVRPRKRQLVLLTKSGARLVCANI